MLLEKESTKSGSAKTKNLANMQFMSFQWYEVEQQLLRMEKAGKLSLVVQMKYNNIWKRELVQASQSRNIITICVNEMEGDECAEFNAENITEAQRGQIKDLTGRVVDVHVKRMMFALNAMAHLRTVPVDK